MNETMRVSTPHTMYQKGFSVKLAHYTFLYRVLFYHGPNFRHLHLFLEIVVLEPLKQQFSRDESHFNDFAASRSNNFRNYVDLVVASLERVVESGNVGFPAEGFISRD